MDAATHLALSLAALLLARPLPLARLQEAPASSLAAIQEPDSRPDRWFGEDKFRHLGMSFAVTSFSFAAARSAGIGDAAAPAAVAAALTAGIGKELYDARSGSFFSVRDFAWDVAGVLVGYAVARNVR